MRYFSPAKINLFFRVLRKRPDNFHEIASLMQAIDLCDILTFESSSCDILTCSDPTLACDDSNLVTKALKLFRQRYEFSSIHIHLEKYIPMQAGLGGGSSNAATVLWALNERIGRKAALTELLSMAAQLGSDVPFFFSLGSAYCTGRGEIVESFSTAPINGYLAKPSFGLSTPLVYRETRVDELPLRDPLQARAHLQFFNDLEFAAFRIEPRLAQLKEQLIACGFSSVSMTGSGTAFFCIDKQKCHRPQLNNVLCFPFRTLLRDSFSWYGACIMH